jgi:hypothetical protein
VVCTTTFKLLTEEYDESATSGVKQRDMKDVAEEAGRAVWGGACSSTIRGWAAEIELHEGFVESEQGRYERLWILDQPDLRTACQLHLRAHIHKRQKGDIDGTTRDYMAKDFQEFVNELLRKVKPDELMGVSYPIKYETALEWMHRLGATYDMDEKSINHDAHNTAENLDHREWWLGIEKELELKQYLWVQLE